MSWLSCWGIVQPSSSGCLLFRALSLGSTSSSTSISCFSSRIILRSNGLLGMISRPRYTTTALGMRDSEDDHTSHDYLDCAYSLP